MAAYIERDCLLDKIQYRGKPKGTVGRAIRNKVNNARDIILAEPTVDAVEVVRCNDCKHWSELNGKDSGKPVGYGDCRNGCGINGIAYLDSFCSYGERRTDG